MKRILVVDDDPAVRSLLAEVLCEQYAVSVATNGAEALRALSQRPPDAVVLDMMMPVMNGWTFLRECRTQPECADVPVIVVSAESTACEDGRRLGAQLCLPKPFDLDTLRDAVDEVIRHPLAVAADRPSSS